MQLLLSLSLSLLTIMPAICWPMNDNDYQPQNGGGMIESYQSPYLPPYDGGNEGGMMESYQSPYLPPYDGGRMMEFDQPPNDGGNKGGMTEPYQEEDGLMLQRENVQQQYFEYAERQGT